MKRRKFEKVERIANVMGDEVVIRIRRNTPVEIRRGGAIDKDKRRYTRKTKHKNQEDY